MRITYLVPLVKSILAVRTKLQQLEVKEEVSKSQPSYVETVLAVMTKLQQLEVREVVTKTHLLCNDS